MKNLLALALIFPAPAFAQTRVAAPVATALPGVALPALATNLPRLAQLSTPLLPSASMLVSPKALPSVRPIPLLAQTARPVAAVPAAFGQPAAANAPRTVVEMGAFSSALEAGRSEPGALEKGLAQAYEGTRRQPGTAVVDASVPQAVPSGLAPALRGLSAVRRSVEEPAPPTTSPRKKVVEALKKVGGTLFGLYGGMKLGDIVYSLLVHRMPLAGGALAAAGIAAAVWYLRRTRETSGRGPLMPSLAGTFAFTVLGNLLWTLTGSAVVGLSAGLVLGLAAGLYAGGVLFPDKR